MTTAMITDCFTGLVRAAGILISVIICAEFLYSPLLTAIAGPTSGMRVTHPYRFNLLFSGACYNAKENGVCNPDRFKLLFSGAFYNAKENSVCNPYRFKNASKLTALAVGFIFFINHCKYHSSILWRTSVKPKDVFTNPGTRKLTTCL